MKEYIEKAAALEALSKSGVTCNMRAHKIVASIQAADVVEVTFCKDCRYYQNAKVNEKGFLICPASGMEITETDFCSYGQRKEDDHETAKND